MTRLWNRMAAVAAAAMSGVALNAQEQASALAPAAATESIKGGTLLLVAYGFVWAVVVIYVLMLWRRTGRVAEELAEVSAKLAARSGKRA
jgi:hypothetical protein